MCLSEEEAEAQRLADEEKEEKKRLKREEKEKKRQEFLSKRKEVTHTDDVAPTDAAGKAFSLSVSTT